jgi:glycosyltransferase involved in cell wall biosynthesis
MHVPLVSVIIPLFNGAAYIQRSVGSVLTQTFADFELIVVDDGSTDNGAELAIESGDPRIKVIRQQNQGVSAARNRGVREGRSKYVAFLDADDEWTPDFLGAVVRLSAIYPNAGIFAAGYRLVFPKGPSVAITAEEGTRKATAILIEDYFYRSQGTASLIHSSGVMVPRSVLDEVGGFLVGEHHGEDLEMWARIALRYPIAYDTRVLFSFHQTGIANKPRFVNRCRAEPKITMLQRTLDQRAETSVSRALIREHIKDWLQKTCFSLALRTDRTATLQYMKLNNASVFLPRLSLLLEIRSCWLIFRLVSQFQRIQKSRLMLRVVGGERRTHKVLEKLIYP